MNRYNGPWRVDYDGRILDKDGAPVCIEDRQTARLIAAAPDMYDWLKYIAESSSLHPFFGGFRGIAILLKDIEK